MLGGMQQVARQKKVKRAATVGGLKNVLREAERSSANGATGATILKLSRTPITRLVETKRIGPVELQSASDIEDAFMALSGALMFKPMNMEKLDRGYHSDWSSKTTESVLRYRAWASHWSICAKWGDPTLQIVITAIIDQRPFYQIEADLQMRHGLAARVTVRGLRDYAARAGWADHRTAMRWKAEAASTFRVTHPELRMAMVRAQSTDCPPKNLTTGRVERK